MPKYHDIEQGSEEWFELRIGLITSSHFAEIMVNTINKKGEYDDLAKWGEGAKKYAMRLALERSTEKRLDTFQNDWMARGNELEPEAREKYECKTFSLVENGGLFISDGEKKDDGLGDYAASPDGLVSFEKFKPEINKDTWITVKGGIEIKCVAYNTHFAVMEEEFYDKKYKWQIQGQMFVADLKFIDFVSYSPEHPESHELYIYRVERNNILCGQIEKRLEQFKKLINTYAKLISKKD